jgi:gamma-tubulin complex component 4
VIEEIRDCVASRLWHLVLIKSQLLSDLKALKSYFLLAKGEFFHTLLEEARDMMTLPPKSTAEFDLN